MADIFRSGVSAMNNKAKRVLPGRIITLLLGLYLFGALILSSALAQSAFSPGYAAGDARYNSSERAGREIWFYATAFNDRFFTYSYPQRLGAAIDWYKVLGAENKNDLFPAWGAIPDPDCCIPGSTDCPAKSLEETYGFQWCPGDDELLKFVGQRGYRDPACDFEDSTYSQNHGPTDQRQSACDLKFGTSTGALGFRKFPNPRFDADKWRQLNGSLASWDAYRQYLDDSEASADSRVNRLFDGSVEPPFRVGIACGSCHIAFDPLNPPEDPANPEWSNIDGLVGNQYSRISNLLGSGMHPNRLEWQLIARARPGLADTSALPMDTVSNPGTMNAIINLDRRPTHEHEVLKWRKAAQCAAGAPESVCWCEPGKPGKCWERSTKTEQVHNILKGGEDSIGVLEAIQRVYFNIGSCAEQCWLNHVPDLRAIDPAQRNYGQTPFDIGQCRRDCPSFRAIEDRLEDVFGFFLTARPTDLWRARGHEDPRDLEIELEEEFFEGAVEMGRQVYGRSCARCHSSQDGADENTDFHITVAGDPTLRTDWLGNDDVSLASEIGTYSARALHSNHMPSRVWEQYASLSLHEREPDPNLDEVLKGNGRGYYRNISLLSTWAHAPFMQNNAIGPELCGQPSREDLDFYSSPYVNDDLQPLRADAAPPCWAYDPSVEGRYKLYKASMEALLNPDKRIPKMYILDEPIIVDVAPEIEIGDIKTGFRLEIPAGTPAVMLNSLRYKDLVQDVVLLHRKPQKLADKYQTLLSDKQFKELQRGLKALHTKIVNDPARVFDITKLLGDNFIQAFYSNLMDRIENKGHRFGEDLTPREKQALIAFIATL